MVKEGYDARWRGACSQHKKRDVSTALVMASCRKSFYDFLIKGLPAAASVPRKEPRRG